MAIHLYWQVPDRVFISYFWDHLSVEQLREANRLAYDFVQTGKPLVHNVVDMTELKSYPKNLPELVNTFDVFKEPNYGWVIVVTTDRMVEYLSMVITQVSKMRFRVFKDRQSALEFLSHVDQTLPELNSYKLLRE